MRKFTTWLDSLVIKHGNTAEVALLIAAFTISIFFALVVLIITG